MLNIQEGMIKNNDTAKDAPKRLHNIRGILNDENYVDFWADRGAACAAYFEDQTLVLDFSP